MEWSNVVTIIEKVHNNLSGHSAYSEINVPLQRNGIWNDGVRKYLTEMLEKCQSRKTTSLPKQTRKFSLRSVNRSFNQDVCVNHIFFDETCVFHVMDLSSHNSAEMGLPNTGMKWAVLVFGVLWVSSFWSSDTAIGDKTFKSEQFTDYLNENGSHIRDFAKTTEHECLRGEHRSIRDIYLRFKYHAGEFCVSSIEIMVQKALRISNDLYGNEITSASELEKGYTRPALNNYTPLASGSSNGLGNCSREPSS